MFRLFLIVFYSVSVIGLTGCSESDESDPESIVPAVAGEAEEPVAAEVAVVVVDAQKHVSKKTLSGRTSAYRISEVRPQVTGIVKKRLFEEGTLVEAGEALYQIDSDQYQARVEQAVADVALAKASLVSLKSNMQRYQQLIHTKGISEQDFETAQAEYRQGLARLQSSQALLKSAQIDLQRTRITAPISGRIGRSNVTEGALVSIAQEAPLATIQQLDPIFVDMVQSSQQLIHLKRRMASGGLKPAGTTVTLTLEDGLGYEHSGNMQFTEVNVDARTGAVTLRAQFPNPDRMLLPGMYVRAEVQQGSQENVILIPQQAVIHNEKGEPVAWVVNDDNKVQERVLELIGSESGQWIVSNGLAAGERLIVEGLQRVHPGAAVVTVDWKQNPAVNKKALDLTAITE